MTIGYKNAGFQFRLTAIEGNSFSARTRQNVKKRIENIVYLSSPPKDAVKLAYVGSNEVNSNNNLYIGDRSDSLYENSREGKVQEIIDETEAYEQAIDVNNFDFIFTQEFKDADSGSIPMYYSHTLSDDYTSIVAESIRIYDKNFEPVGEDKFKVVLDQNYNEDTGRVLDPPVYTEYRVINNLKSYFEETSGDYQVYYIQYTKVVDTTDVTVTELLSNELSYHEATFVDKWHATGGNQLAPWARAYVFTDSGIVPAKAGQFAVKYEESKKLSVKQPTRTEATSPWFPRISNSAFSLGGNSYKIPEFENQSFNPIEPYKTAVNVSCLKIDKRLIKLSHEKIKTGSIFSNIYIEITDEGVIKYALTDDPSYIGTDYRDLDDNIIYDENEEIIQWSNSSLLGLDKISGIVNVDFDLYDKYSIKAIYSYEEEHFELTSLNMNPLFDSSVSTGIRAIYIVPENTYNENTGRQKESIRWISISPSGFIVDTNQDSSGANEKLSTDVTYSDSFGQRLSGVIGMHYSRRATGITTDSIQDILDNISGQKLKLIDTTYFPIKGWARFLSDEGTYKYFEFIDKDATGIFLAGDIPYSSMVASGSTIELVNFVDERTVLTYRTAEEEKELSAVTSSIHSNYFVLAELSVNPPHSYKDVVEIDLRENGGGVIEDKYDEAKAKQPEVQWYNDYGGYNGQVHPGNASLVIKLPASIRERFTELQIEDIVEKYVPLGIKPIIRYYGYAPEIISVKPVADVLGFGMGPFGQYIFGGA